MIYTEIKNENALRSNIKKLFEEYGSISRGSSSDSQLKECTEMALQIMTKKTVSGKWYMISATDEDLSALSRYRDVLVDAYGLLGRGLARKMRCQSLDLQKRRKSRIFTARIIC